MTKEEIQEARKDLRLCESSNAVLAITRRDAGRTRSILSIPLHLAKALDALEEANREMSTVVDALKLYRDKYDDVPELASDLSRIISVFGESMT